MLWHFCKSVPCTCRRARTLSTWHESVSSATCCGYWLPAICIQISSVYARSDSHRMSWSSHILRVSEDLITIDDNLRKLQKYHDDLRKLQKHQSADIINIVPAIFHTMVGSHHQCQMFSPSGSSSRRCHTYHHHITCSSWSWFPQLCLFYFYITYLDVSGNQLWLRLHCFGKLLGNQVYFHSVLFLPRAPWTHGLCTTFCQGHRGHMVYVLSVFFVYRFKSWEGTG